MVTFDLVLRDGNHIPVLGLGTYQLGGVSCTDTEKRAIELGYTHIDTADAYGNHKAIGEAIKAVDRSSIFITSKVWPNNLGYHDVIRTCYRSLDELGTEYLDLYLIHWPNENIPIQETLRAFNELVDEGKVKSIGVSNFEIHHLIDALNVEEYPITNNQVRFYPYNYDPELLRFCQQQRIVVTAYSPLGRTRIFNNSTIQEMANKYNRSPAQICLRWCLQKGVVVVPKTRSETRLQENKAIFDWELSSKDMMKLNSPN